MRPPICGVKPKSNYCHDSKQVYLPEMLSPEFDKVRKVIRDAYRCECESEQNVKQIGRSTSNNPEVLQTALEVDRVRKLTHCYLPKKMRYNVTILQEEYKCPWLSFYEPLFDEVARFLELEKIPGTKSIGPETDCVVYEAVLLYKKYYDAIDLHIKNEEHKKREDKVNKSGKNNSGQFKPPKW